MPKGLKVVVALNIVSALVIAWGAVMLGGGFTAGTPFPPNVAVQMRLEPIERIRPRASPQPIEAQPVVLPFDPRDSAPRWVVDHSARIRSEDPMSAPPPWQRAEVEPRRPER